MEVRSAQTRLIFLRGNSGSGKHRGESASRDLRTGDRLGPAGSAPADDPQREGPPRRGQHWPHRPGNALLLGPRLPHHRGWHPLRRSCFIYLDVSLEETFRRHAARPQAAEFRPDDMRNWYRPRDLLASVREHVIPETSTLEQTIDTIVTRSQLAEQAADGKLGT